MGVLIPLRNTTDAAREALAMLSRESSTPEVLEHFLHPLFLSFRPDSDGLLVYL